MTTEQYRQLKIKAGFEGLYTGLLWLASFACYLMSLKTPSYSTPTWLIALGSAVFVILRLRSYRNSHLDELTFGKAFSYSLSVYLYASLVMALGQWIYFQYIDNGYMVEIYTQQMNAPEMRKLMASVPGLKEDMNLALEQLKNMRPIEASLQFLMVDVILSLVMALPTAFVAKGKAKRKDNDPFKMNNKS